MAILSYVPKKKNITDYRSEDGGYYEVECENCGTVFYPKRSDAKHCSKNCTMITYRQQLAKGGAIRSHIKKNEEPVNEIHNAIRDCKNRCKELGTHVTLIELRAMNVGETIKPLPYEPHGIRYAITRVSPRRYVITRGH